MVLTAGRILGKVYLRLAKERFLGNYARHISCFIKWDSGYFHVCDKSTSYGIGAVGLSLCMCGCGRSGEVESLVGDL
jgi:hypothetical protein